MGKEKILIIGGSGFIGTNLVQYYLEKGFEVKNFDINVPRDFSQLKQWTKVDILDNTALSSLVSEFNPSYVLHMAARTDLRETYDISGYRANMDGVKNVINALKQCKEIKRVIFASSMLVCKVGYDPVSYDDYCPSTLYGESKVITERIIKESNLEFEWVIIRPTSIWGPWFGEPYSNFFKMVKRNLFFKIKGKTANKVFGFVGNAVFQIDQLLFMPNLLVNKKVFYLGDLPEYNINEWASEVASIINVKLLTFPRLVFELLASIGDLLNKVGVRFPMSSFRLKNMIQDNRVSLLENTFNVVPVLPYKRIDGVKITLNWMREQGQ